ncbi:MAG: VOC family protein [Hyphomicrobiaceae bacterium]|nr:VOC family protein [Hyphomicrobiaceae bacterium]
MPPPAPKAILETILYAEDLETAESFYRDVLGFEVYARSPARQVFFKLADQMLLIFNPKATVIPLPEGARFPVPPHGAVGEGHVCFAATAQEIEDWKTRLEAAGIAIEAEFRWPSGGRSIYFRDPAGNCLEFAEANIWGFET